MVRSIECQYGEGLGLLAKKDTRYGHCGSRRLATTGRVPGVAGPPVEDCYGVAVVASRSQPVRHIKSTAGLVEGNPEIGREKASIGHRRYRRAMGRVPGVASPAINHRDGAVVDVRYVDCVGDWINGNPSRRISYCHRR